MALPPFDDISAVYTRLHAWIYETWVAPAVYPSRWIIDERLLAHLPRGARILDVGSGGGLFTCYMAEQRPDVDITGIDLSRPQLERASRAAQRFGDRVRFVQGSALELPFADESFDGVISYGSIKHWPSWHRGAAECLRVLRRGGPLLVTDADRSVRWDDCTAFVKGWNAPKIQYGVNLALFRTWVAGRSLDLDDARDVAGSLALDDADVGRVDALFYIAGLKAAV